MEECRGERWGQRAGVGMNVEQGKNRQERAASAHDTADSSGIPAPAHGMAPSSGMSLGMLVTGGRDGTLGGRQHCRGDLGYSWGASPL